MGHLVSLQPPEELQCDLAQVSVSVSTALEGCHHIPPQPLLSSLFACRCEEANDQLSTGFLTGSPEVERGHALQDSKAGRPAPVSDADGCF